VSAKVPEELYRRATEVPASENIYVDKLLASAFEERVLEFERLKERAARGRYEKFLRCDVEGSCCASDRPGPKCALGSLF